MLVYYNIIIWCYKCIIYLAALFNAKASQFVIGRKHFFSKQLFAYKPHPNTIWMHCASLGEYEQGLPVLQLLKQHQPDIKIVLTFFSPSGYNHFKANNAVDETYYLPFDTAQNAKKFITIIKPHTAIFVKYELWYHYLNTLNEKKIPVYLISAFITPNSIFTKWYGALHRKMLAFFNHIFVQDQRSLHLLHNLGFNNITIAGDTRFDRVEALKNEIFNDAIIADFCNKNKVIIAGSTWPADEALLFNFAANNPEYKLIIAPHNVSQENIKRVQNLFASNSTLYSNQNLSNNKQILILNTIGILNKVYRYGTTAYIGGGFGAGIHNILEPTVYGLPVFFGPNYNRFLEAHQLLHLKLATVVNNYQELQEAIPKSSIELAVINNNLCTYFDENSGASTTIIKHILAS
jgi:3-deoxy-D-manno-octulosonic-acid transferase